MSLKIGDYALFGADKKKRIYIGEVNRKYLAVHIDDETRFKIGNIFQTIQWDSVEEILEPEYYYQWVYDNEEGEVTFSNYCTNEEADKPKQWQPKGGEWYRAFGVERQTKEELELASKAMRTHNRLLAYIAEFDKGWEADWSDGNQEKYYIYFCYSKQYDISFDMRSKDIGKVYMSKQCAIDLTNKLNSGEVSL